MASRLKRIRHNWNISTEFRRWWLTLLYIKDRYRPPGVYRLATLHAGMTFLTLAMMPSPSTMPSIALPIFWGGSLAATVIIYSFCKLPWPL
jgi:hypothetical protein